MNSNDEISLPSELDGWKIDWSRFWIPPRETQPPYFYCFDRLYEFDNLGFLFHSLSERSNGAYYGHLVILADKPQPRVLRDYQKRLFFNSVKSPITKREQYIALHNQSLNYIIIDIEKNCYTILEGWNSFQEPILLLKYSVFIGGSKKTELEFRNLEWMGFENV